MENGKESEVLLHNDLTVLDHSECFRRLPKILSYDKLCGIKGSGKYSTLWCWYAETTIVLYLVYLSLEV